MDNSYGMQNLQRANLFILQEIDRICTKYRINYTLDSGTLLGAIRHGGFIPWDDDADIAMTRASFEAFKRIVRRELSDKLEFIMPDEFKGGSVFYDFTPRIIYKASARHEDKKNDPYEGKLNHIWVDIFIIDKLPNNSTLRKIVLFTQKIIYLFAMGHRQKLELHKYKGLMKLGVLIFSTIGKVLPMKALFKIQDKISRFYSKSKNNRMYYYSNYQPDYIDLKFKDEWFENYSKILFEEVMLSVSDEYDNILTAVYGNYMTLPPKCDRVPTHGSTEIEIYE